MARWCEGLGHCCLLIGLSRRSNIFMIRHHTPTGTKRFGARLVSSVTTQHQQFSLLLIVITSPIQHDSCNSTRTRQCELVAGNDVPVSAIMHDAQQELSSPLGCDGGSFQSFYLCQIQGGVGRSLPPEAVPVPETRNKDFVPVLVDLSVESPARAARRYPLDKLCCCPLAAQNRCMLLTTYLCQRCQ
jgi:hypothetical protein